jgi:FkbM family methyltransferase
MSLFEKINNAIHGNLQKAGIKDHYSHYLLNSGINKNSTVIDLGANKGGFYSLMSAKYNCYCFAVEASESLFNSLPKIDKVRCYHFAIGKNNGSIKFYISKNSEANSLQLAISEAWGVTTSTIIEEKTLEKFLSDENIPLPVDILKIDVEGAETDIINSLSANTLSRIGQIPVEFHDFILGTEQYNTAMHEAIKKLTSSHFLALKLSAQDWRETLFINTRLIQLSKRQKMRLTIIHPFLQNLKLLHINTSRLFKSAQKNKK